MEKPPTTPSHQAEVILKDFFQKNPPKGFTYVHQGSSSEGQIKYNIGNYAMAEGSYRVVMVIKNIRGQFKIETINFSKE